MSPQREEVEETLLDEPETFVATEPVRRDHGSAK
jgi:hypothetical protein